MRILFPAVVVILLLLNAPAVDACSCGGYPTICGSYQGADVVLIGVVQRVETKTAKIADGREGRFTLIAVNGLKGTLSGFMFTYEGEFENCPQLDNLIRAQGQAVPDIGGKPIPVEITRDMQDIKLTFSFPSCKKRKDE